MKHLKYIFMAFAVALFAASCSQDELLEDGGTEEVPVTFTATVDYAIETQGDDTAGNMKQAATRAGNMKQAATRATSTQDDAPTRFYAQAVSNGTLSKVVEGTRIGDNTYSFTLQVAKDTEYEYMFWADNATTDNEPTDLRSVSYTIGNIAFATKAQGTPETVVQNVKLQHVVAKVTLKTTTNVTSEYSKNISLTASCASKYDVQGQKAITSSFENKSISKEMTDAGLPANSEVLTTYFIPNPEDKTVTLDAHEMTQAISDVPLVANTNVTLQGDLSESSSKWGNPTSAYIETKFQSYFFNENDQPKGYNDGSDDNYYIDNATNESVIALFKEITRSNSFQLPGATSEAKITNNLSIMPMTSNDIYIFYKDTTFIVYLQDEYQYYPDFPSIYPGTNIN